jgi:hypothetical protein
MHIDLKIELGRNTNMMALLQDPLGSDYFVYLFIFQADSISGFHSNTHIPVVIGAQMRYEVTGDVLYKVKEFKPCFLQSSTTPHSLVESFSSGDVVFWLLLRKRKK